MALLHDKKATSDQDTPTWKDTFNNSTDGILGLGVEGKVQNMALYFETGLLARWIYYYYKNPETVTLEDMCTVTFGANYYF